MAELLGLSWVALRTWCNDIPGFEADKHFVRGGNGIEWQFKPVASIQFLIKHFTAEQQRGIQRRRAVRQAIGSSVIDDIDEDLSLEEIDKIIRLQTRLREERERQGQLIDRTVAEDAIAKMVASMQRAGLQAAREQDPTGQWPPEISESFENAVNSLILHMGQAGEKCLSDLRGGSA
ncbi:hypothetical protein GRI97_08155 [Altererythrobacter xixiisoli]|uniref:Uncharacterized protein n=1 Tax=Croceibacterium xixiisoli TaxID=1476466 RepID=A0A6I4TUL4_9SPHN|nr:hypothetical protein [Croceibacterium xixiisoli]MXO98959.1 hypothetical protein [Croceibacterium xixiisoli]